LRSTTTPPPLRPYARAYAYGDCAPSLRSPWRAATELEMEHDGEWHQAHVRREAIRRDVRDVEELSPAELATAIGETAS
jgi:hypothetical protein